MVNKGIFFSQNIERNGLTLAQPLICANPDYGDEYQKRIFHTKSEVG